MIDAKKFYGIENRKKLAADMGLNEQEVLDLTKRSCIVFGLDFRGAR